MTAFLVAVFPFSIFDKTIAFVALAFGFSVTALSGSFRSFSFGCFDYFPKGFGIVCQECWRKCCNSCTLSHIIIGNDRDLAIYVTGIIRANKDTMLQNKCGAS